MDIGNATAYLYAYAQKHGMVLQFKDLGDVGPDHMKVWVFFVFQLNQYLWFWPEVRKWVIIAVFDYGTFNTKMLL